MRIKKRCCLCGAEYYTGNGKAKYCSNECRKEATRQRQKAWREEHPEYHKDYFRDHPEARERFVERHPNYDRDRARGLRGSQEYTKQCIVCGKTFVTWNPNKKTCSDECKEVHKKNRDKGRVRNLKKTPEEQHRQYIIRTYGSEEAHMVHLEELEQKKQAQMEQTKARREQERKERLAANFREGECVVCGKTFTTYNPSQKTCCSECGKKLSYARKQKRIPKAQMIDKDITLEALYRRDSGVCYLCGKPCNWSDKEGFVVGANYPSIDHIIPVSRGGLHAWDNVRLAHFKCNADKSDEIIPEAKKMIPKNAYEFKCDVKPRKKKTLQFTKDNQFLAEYESTAEAERQTGVKQHGIQDCARGEEKSYGGFIWRYA